MLAGFKTAKKPNETAKKKQNPKCGNWAAEKKTQNGKKFGNRQ